MDVREPALPVDPRLPDEPTVLEVGRTRAWLAKRGVMVWLPTRLLALRVGGRALGGQGVPTFAIVIAVSWWLTRFVLETAELPGSIAFEVVLFIAFQVLRWRRAQRREQVAERLAGTGEPLPLREAAKQVGWWYLGSTAITFLGGAVLCAATFLTTPQSHVRSTGTRRPWRSGSTRSRWPWAPARPRWCSAGRSARR